jgi:hypothetical protein
LALSPEVHNFLVREMLDIHMPFSVFNSHADEMAMASEFNQNIFVDVSCLGNFFLREIYEQGIRDRKILHLHHEPYPGVSIQLTATAKQSYAVEERSARQECDPLAFP